MQVCSHGRVDDGAGHPVRARLVAPAVIPGGLNALTLIVLLLTLWHASHSFGVRRTLAFFAITAVTSWLFEEIGVTTGLIYGPYHYTSTLGPWLGSVPVLIPLAWFVLVYTSYGLANLIADRLPGVIAEGRRPLIGLVLLGALVITALDLVVDPILSGPGFRAWVWDTPGPYYGVPIQNYLGWIVTAFVVHLLCRSLERRAMAQPVGQPSTTQAGLLLAYVWSGVSRCGTRTKHQRSRQPPLAMTIASLGGQHRTSRGPLVVTDFWGSGSGRTADIQSNPGCALSRATSPTASSRTSRLFHSTCDRDLEKTIFGLSDQIRLAGAALPWPTSHDQLMVALVRVRAGS
jgi:uncharacterized membrane protein